MNGYFEQYNNRGAFALTSPGAPPVHNQGETGYPKKLADEGITLRENIGSGTYAKVKKAWYANEDGSGGNWVAVKIIDRRRCRADFLLRFLPTELELIRHLQHPNIVHTFEIHEIANSHVCIVEEIAENGDLLKLIRSKQRVPDIEARPIFRQVFEALHYLHDRERVLHRDLKCENILFDRWNNVKLCDFGFACKMPAGHVARTFCGSRHYAAPEILRSIPYTDFAVDIWSAGVVLYVTLTGMMLYDDKKRDEMLRKQMHRKIPFSHTPVVSDARQFIHQLLNPNPTERPKYAEIIQTAWLRNTPWEYRTDTVTYRLVPNPSVESTTIPTAVPSTEESSVTRETTSTSTLIAT